MSFFRNLFLCMISFSLLHAIEMQLPKQFYVTESWISLTSSFSIETDQSLMGSVHRAFFSLIPQYDFYGQDKVLQATAKQRFWALGSIFDITDAEGQPLGTVEEELFSWFPSFRFISNTGQILATATLNLLGTTYTVVDPITNEEIALLYRSFFRLTDNWTVSITNPTLFETKHIDPRFFIITMVFQTDKDNWARRY